MNEKRDFYDAPAAQVIVVHNETRILDASLTGSRKSYGTANEESWD